jgi:hypothetical protein
MSLAQGKSDLKKHLSRHIHIEKNEHPLSLTNVPDAADSSKDHVDPTVAALKRLE